MITRGVYIGEIVDELASIGEKVKMRNRLNLHDLSIYAEDFFKDLLNPLYGISLENLNKERSNEPGLDLGDAASGWAFQITSSATSAKVEKTLAALTVEQCEKYRTNIIVLAIGKAQSSYTIDSALAKKCGFTVDHIWDLDTLARRVVSIPVENLQEVHRIVRTNVVRLRVELEIPDEEGRYKTSGFDDWEARVKPQIGDGAAFTKYRVDEVGELSAKSSEALSKAIARLGRDLARLPRITREFLAMLYERRDTAKSKRVAELPYLLFDKVKREHRGHDLDGELAILDHAGFAHVDAEDPHYNGPPAIVLTISENDDLRDLFCEYIKAKKLSFRRVIGAVDLSAF